MVGSNPTSLPGTINTFNSLGDPPFGPLAHPGILPGLEHRHHTVGFTSGLETDATTFDSTTTTTTAPSTTVQYTEAIIKSMVTLYGRMTGTVESADDTCHTNCSGHGECLNGACFCRVQYEGESCHEPNVAYFASFSCIFFIIALISIVQLVACVLAEYHRLKAPTLRRACCVTTQKMLYIATFVAAAIRGAYFSSPSNAELTLASSFLSSFYPVILTAGSLLVCLWAEAFHLPELRVERPGFLGKSFVGFLCFNLFTYSLFLTEVLLTRQASNTAEQRSFLTHVFNGCYALLMFIMVVFFLIYGVEVYFKVRGGFMRGTFIVGSLHSRVRPHRRHLDATTAAGDEDEVLQECHPVVDGPSTSHAAQPPPTPTPHQPLLGAATTTPPPPPPPPPQKDEVVGVGASGGSEAGSGGEEEVKKKLLKHKTQVRLNLSPGIDVAARGIDYSQLSQSRFGLVFQACMLMITVCFLLSDVLGGFWKQRVPLISRNAYDIIFHVVELGVTLWFPCVLWNYKAPEQLWILNPKKILKRLDIDKSIEVGGVGVQEGDGEDEEGEEEKDKAVADVESIEATPLRECWICYESSADVTSGPLIEPCLCRGDVAAVHQNCLRKWLMECAENSSVAAIDVAKQQLSCKVCKAEYELERSPSWSLGEGFTTQHWLHTASLITVMCCTIAAAWAVLELYQDAMVRSITAGAMLLILYLCLRFLGFNTFKAYKRARVSAVKIISHRFSPAAAPAAGESDNTGASDHNNDISDNSNVSNHNSSGSGSSGSSCSNSRVVTSSESSNSFSVSSIVTEVSTISGDVSLEISASGLPRMLNAEI